METLFIIIFCCICYGIVGALIGAYWNVLWKANEVKFDKDDQEFITALTWIFWPISVFILLIYYMPYTYIFKKLIK